MSRSLLTSSDQRPGPRLSATPLIQKLLHDRRSVHAVSVDGIVLVGPQHAASNRAYAGRIAAYRRGVDADKRIAAARDDAVLEIVADGGTIDHENDRIPGYGIDSAAAVVRQGAFPHGHRNSSRDAVCLHGVGIILEPAIADDNDSVTAHGRLHHYSTAGRWSDSIAGNDAVVHLENGIGSIRGEQNADGRSTIEVHDGHVGQRQRVAAYEIDADQSIAYSVDRQIPQVHRDTCPIDVNAV